MCTFQNDYIKMQTAKSQVLSSDEGGIPLWGC